MDAQESVKKLTPASFAGVALFLAASACGSDRFVVIPEEAPQSPPRTFAVCDEGSDFQVPSEVPGLDVVSSIGGSLDYWIDATLTDDERHMYFTGCSRDRRSGCVLLHATFEDSGYATDVGPARHEGNRPRHPSVSSDRSTIVWAEDGSGSSTRIFMASRTGLDEYESGFSGTREIMVLPRDSSQRYADPFVGRDKRLYVMLGPGSGVSTLHSAPLAGLTEDTVPTIVDAALTGTSPVVDGANRMFIGRYDSNTGLRTILVSERDASGKFGKAGDRYVKGLNAEGTSNYPTWVSKDGCRLYFTRGTQGSVDSYRIWMAERRAKR